MRQLGRCWDVAQPALMRILTELGPVSGRAGRKGRFELTSATRNPEHFTALDQILDGALNLCNSHQHQCHCPQAFYLRPQTRASPCRRQRATLPGPGAGPGRAGRTVARPESQRTYPQIDTRRPMFPREVSWSSHLASSVNHCRVPRHDRMRTRAGGWGLVVPTGLTASGPLRIAVV